MSGNLQPDIVIKFPVIKCPWSQVSAGLSVGVINCSRDKVSGDKVAVDQMSGHAKFKPKCSFSDLFALKRRILI